MAKLRLFALFAAVLAVACRDRGHHPYQSAPPAAAIPQQSVPVVPDLPIGTTSPEARILSIRDRATGAPVTLSGIKGPFNVMGVAARGPQGWQAGPDARVELRIRGPRDTTFAIPMDSPESSIVAHDFQVGSADPGQWNFPAGHYTMQLVLLVRGNVVHAETVPLHFDVRR